MPMFPHVPLIADETLISWAARAARAQTGFGLPRFLSLTNNDRLSSLRQIVNEEQVRHLGDALGGEFEGLARIAWLRRPDGMVLHRGQTFHKSHLRRGRTAFCPHCLLEDGRQKYDRAMWHLSTGFSCSRHNVPLVVQTSVNDRVEAFLPELAFPSDGELHTLAGNLPPIKPTRFQLYIERRLDGQNQCSVLDRLPLGEVVHCVEILARGLTGDFSKSSLGVGVAELETARAESFEAFALGEPGLNKVFCRIMARAAARGSCYAAETALGRVYTLTRLGGLASALKAPMRAFLVDRLPLAAGTEILGATVSARTRHSLQTLKVASGLTQGMLDVVSEWLEPLHPGENLPPESMVFDAVAAEEVVERITKSIRLDAMHERLGCDKTTARSILAAGLVEQITGAAQRGGHAPLPRITRRSVGLLMTSISDVATHLAHTKPGLITMSLAAKHQRWQVDRVIRLALAGKIDLYHVIGRDDFDSFLVDEEQIRRIIEMSPLAERMTKQEAAQAFQVDLPTIETIMRLGDESGAPYIRRVVPISGPQLHRHQVAKADFDRFAADYVSVGCLAADLGKTKDQVVADLHFRGISPIPFGLSADNQVYRRADI